MEPKILIPYLDSKDTKKKLKKYAKKHKISMSEYIRRAVSKQLSTEELTSI